MKTIVRISLAALAITVFASNAAAQGGYLGYMPAYTSPKGYQGLMISGDWGMGMNDDAKLSDDAPMAFGGALGYGSGKFNILAGASYVDPKVDGVSKPISFGGLLGFTLLQKAESPLSVNVFGGAGYWSVSDTAGNGLYTQLQAPFGVGISFAPPSSGSVSFEIWGAPRGQYVSVTPEGADATSEIGFGAAGGVNVNFAQGFGIHAAIDYLNVGGDLEGSPMVVGAGLHYNFKMN
jgi:hypothetical protein